MGDLQSAECADVPARSEDHSVQLKYREIVCYSAAVTTTTILLVSK